MKPRRSSARSITSMRIAIVGAGKVGRALYRAARAAGATRVTLRAARKGLPRKRLDADLVVLCVRDRELEVLAEGLAAKSLVSPTAVCVHVAGALDAEVLAALRRACAGVAQMHPMISFADKNRPPRLLGGHVHVKGDPIAERRARRFARALGMVPRTFRRFDPVGYHAAAAFVANGAAVLAALGAKILQKAGVPLATAPRMLGPLVGSVADNIGTLGFPACLTGPVRRGDAGAIEKHFRVLASRVPDAMELYLASVAGQLPLARELADAAPERFDEVEATLNKLRRRGSG